MTREMALFLYGMTFVVEGLMALYRWLKPTAGAVFA